MLDLKGNRLTYFGHSAFSLTQRPVMWVSSTLGDEEFNLPGGETRAIAGLEIHALRPGENL